MRSCRRRRGGSGRRTLAPTTDSKCPPGAMFRLFAGRVFARSSGGLSVCLGCVSVCVAVVGVLAGCLLIAAFVLASRSPSTSRHVACKRQRKENRADCYAAGAGASRPLLRRIPALIPKPQTLTLLHASYPCMPACMGSISLHCLVLGMLTLPISVLAPPLQISKSKRAFNVQFEEFLQRKRGVLARVEEKAQRVNDILRELRAQVAWFFSGWLVGWCLFCFALFIVCWLLCFSWSVWLVCLFCLVLFCFVLSFLCVLCMYVCVCGGGG